jgi:hypothetical protein
MGREVEIHSMIRKARSRRGEAGMRRTTDSLTMDMLHLREAAPFRHLTNKP